MNSLQGNVLRVIVGTLLLSWAASFGVLWTYLKLSETSIADHALQGFATRVLQAIPAKMGTHPAPAPPSGESPALQPASPARFGDEMAFQVWADRTRLVTRTPGAPASALKPDFADGYASLVVEGERWRVFSVSDQAHRMFVQVGRRHGELDREFQRKALVALAFTTVLLGLVGLLTFLAMRWSLRPVVALETTLRQRATFDLTRLSTDRLPAELKPLVESFNHVLAQLDEAVEGERRFIGDAAHELRTPLAALQAQAHVALHARTAAEKDAALVKLVAVAERNTRLSEQLLDLARLNAGEHAPQREVADLAELVVHVAREFEVSSQTNERGLALDVAPARISCNIDEVGILLRNLVDNALRYTQRHGRVRIRCGVVDTASGPAGYVEVADDGPGVPAGEREAIFRRFHRVPGNGTRGSGIGLSLVAGIARLHHALITTGTGIDGRGLSVRVRFPPAPSGDAAA